MEQHTPSSSAADGEVEGEVHGEDDDGGIVARALAVLEALDRGEAPPEGVTVSRCGCPRGSVHIVLPSE